MSDVTTILSLAPEREKLMQNTTPSLSDVDRNDRKGSHDFALDIDARRLMGFDDLQKKSTPETA